MVFSFNYDEFLVYQGLLDDEFLVVVDEVVLFRSYDEDEVLEFINFNLEEELNEFN